MKGEIIAIEGVCCAGKTTLVKKLSSRLKAAVVPELPEFSRNLFRPFMSKKDILYNSHQSFPIEKIRMITATGLSEIAPYVLLDRSYLSTLALGYGAIDLIGVEAYRELVEHVMLAVISDELPTPDKTLYLNIDGETVKNRNETRTPQLTEYWVNPERIERQNIFYQRLSLLDGFVIINGTRAPEIVLDDCVDLSLNSPNINRESFLTSIEKFYKHIT